ncbi:MAG: DUF2161 family putative PD-(D/E)XK-type phosphodiesterase [Planctomycetes bacterium]|nr:DUF2161 family putative PD-(D/E)XK-type phosphodiesterase [Planctomycetota bacterium]
MGQPRETDLYPHLEAWLVDQGYTVHAEVRGCDIVAVKDGQLVQIEIKRAITMSLLQQIVRRQQAGRLVYGAIPAPRDPDAKAWRESVRVMQRLEAGLILVYMEDPPRVELLLQPSRLDAPVRKSLAKGLLAEVEGRSLNVNVGGSPGWSSMDARKEKALRLAVAIDRFGPSSKQFLSLVGASSLTGSILRQNRDGWFQRVGPGKFGLTERGRQALVDNAPLTKALRVRLATIPFRSG